MSKTVHGACLCGQVTFDVHELGAMGFCHCTRCQRWSGGAGLPEIEVDASSFEVTAGQELITHFAEEGFSGFGFCDSCGSSLYAFGGGKFYVSAGTLEDVAFEPEYHMMVAYKAPWDVITGDAPQYPEFPPEA
jgi:hypothetical protein